MKNNIMIYQLVLSGLLVVLGYFLFDLNRTILFSIGMMIGIGLMWLDESIFYKYYISPVTDAQGLPVWQLMTRSMLFILTFVPLSIFVATSTGNTIGEGIILSIGLVLATEMFFLRKNLVGFNTRFLALMSKKLTNTEINWLSWGMAGWLLVVCFLVFV